MTNYSELSDFEINKRVALVLHPKLSDWRCLDIYGAARFIDSPDVQSREREEFNYCNNIFNAWPIILDEGICLRRRVYGRWQALKDSDDGNGMYRTWIAAHKNPLRAAMIVFLMMREGGE